MLTPSSWTVTNGSSIGCNTTGFPATLGWDPVSGFGTPVSLTLFSLFDSSGNQGLIENNQYFPKLKTAALGGGMRYGTFLFSVLLYEMTDRFISVSRTAQVCIQLGL